ncbi:ADP-ribosylation factor-binding protein GGA3-like [Sinocyclocheilus rhinocerous]|uniref:ADP-ribosylation factor-binding protein GGA3-like n=1 Tax=Sinocyclocheilus rhinocerous TaxID=307959 RepID=UPI0007B9C5BF|nr:PREDICTED: ADP-ribosylation factor-binding protein GGA3-like [Sinocyclocheilus rhinocerous]XP_016422947.1 PREDICTED: ADP-ribosylation factor-binding protein GGA3-like [Sinocyclocheilus rhinocerous]
MRIMAFPEGESLESWLNKATHPTNRQEDWEYIIGFCDQINKELEGPQIAVRLLVQKIHSQEWEALQALTVLEACMKNCGQRFHNEIARYRFLNELIKVVSPKYMGDSVSDKVKNKIIEMLYSWTVVFPNEAKIADVYQTLKRQGLVMSDPELTVDKTLIPSPPTRPKNPVFDNEDMGKLLAELLRSKNPEDLQEANRLIKNMVKEDEARVQKMTKRSNTLEEVNNNVKLLSEMLSHYDRNRSSDADHELIKELYERCDKLRRTAFKLATEAEDNDSSLGDILKANDDLSRVIRSYQRIVEGQVDDGEGEDLRPAASEGCETTGTLIDLAGLDEPSSPPTVPPPSLPPQVPSANPTASPIPVLPPPPRRLAGNHGSQMSSPSHKPPEQQTSLSLLDDELLSLGLNDPSSVPNRPTLDELSGQWTSLQAPDPGLDLFGSISAPSAVFPTTHTPAQTSHTPAVSQGLQDLSMLDFGSGKSVSGLTGIAGGTFGLSGGVMGSAAAPLQSTNLFVSAAVPGSPAVARAQAVMGGSAPGSPFFLPFSSPFHSLQSSPARSSEPSLSNLYVPLESIRPSKVLPVTVYDKDGVRVLMHFAMDCPPGRPDVLVMVVSLLNTAPLPVRNIVLQAAVPKSMRVKLQPPSGTEIVPFNPILPPASITQVMLLANPLKECVRLRYKLTYLLGERQYSEVGELDQFPPVDRWGSL